MDINPPFKGAQGRPGSDRCGGTASSRTVVEGMAAGVAATVAMSVPMMAAGRIGAMGGQPPRKVAEHALGRAGAGDTSEHEQNVAASLAHLAFGAGGGGAFAFVHRRLGLPVPTVVQGVAFGLAVWATSYKGWIPALGLLPPPERDRPGRRRTMVLAHVVFGAVLGSIEKRLCQRSAGGTTPAAR